MANNKIKVKIGSDIKGFKSGASQVKSQLKNLAGFAAGVFGVSALVSGFKKLTGIAAKFEQTALSFKVMMGSAKEAKKILAELTDFSTKTPFEPEQVYKAGKQLLAFGVNAEGVLPLLEKIGDVSAGTGKDFNELTLIMGKVFAKGKVDSEALNQMSEAGIPIVKTLGEMYNKTGAEIYKMASKGEIGFDSIDKAFSSMTSEGGIFNNMMAQQSETLNGLMSTLQGNITEIGKGIANSWIPALKEVVKYANDFAKIFAEINKSKSDAKSYGITTKDQAEKNIRSQIEKELQNNPAYANEFKKKMQGYSGFKNSLKQIGDQFLYVGSGWSDSEVKNRNTPYEKAMKSEIAKRMGQMGFEDNNDIISTGISKEQVQAANKKKQDDKAAQEAAAKLKAEAEKAAADEKAEKAAEKQQKKQAAFLADMKHKLEMQKLINAGKEKEAAIENELYNLKKRGVEITPEIRARVAEMEKLKEQNKDKDLNKDTSSQAPAKITTDRLARIGGIIGNSNKVVNQIDIKRNQLLETIAKNTTPDIITLDNEDYSKWG